MIGAVILLSFLLLVVVFRSIVVPLKAALLNLLGIGASYGVIVAVFQWGWGEQTSLGLEGTVPVVSFIPLFMFAILFGLSMDYEVFLLSRIREDYVGHRRQHARGGARDRRHGRVITSRGPDHGRRSSSASSRQRPLHKMFGIGLATAIAGRRHRRSAWCWSPR